MAAQVKAIKPMTEGSQQTPPVELIRRKRDGLPLTEVEIKQLIEMYQAGRLLDTQMTAFAMATAIRGMNDDETYFLTKAMLQSGTTLNWDANTIVADKHSTGGVGDKSSLLIAPLLASFGVQVPMISGRGLGITGGTLDKLESIPGFQTSLTLDTIQDIVKGNGCVIAGATDQIAPADKKLYSLRDVTGTVASVPLITSSILAKKLAEKPNALIFDVKCGSGTSMQSLEQARELATSLVNTCERFHVKAKAIITDMDQPLGTAIGNTAEVREALLTFHGSGPPDLIHLVTTFTYELLQLAGRSVSFNDVTDNLTNGHAQNHFEAMVEKQGGQLCQLPGLHWTPLIATEEGFIKSINTGALGALLVRMGGGRQLPDDTIDSNVAIAVAKKVGDQIAKGDVLGAISHPSPKSYLTQLQNAIHLSNHPVEPRPLIMGTISQTPT
tara:strand:+ start:359 stop:1681 length:1323 start_codon:yes stop_codon:yes gene_type:complete